MNATIRNLYRLHAIYYILGDTTPSLYVLAQALTQKGIAKAVFYFDKTVSNPGKLAALTHTVWEEHNLICKIISVISADTALYNKPTVITTNAIILERCSSGSNLAYEMITTIMPQRQLVELITQI